MSPWLAPVELQDLTGYRRPHAQIAWLKRNGFVEQADFFVTAAGHPRMLRAALETRKAPAKASTATLRAVEPNLAAIR